MRVLRPAPLVADDPPEWVVYDDTSRCPYLAEQTARIPLRLPVRPLNAQQFAHRLRIGDRRQGALLYRPECPTCRACEAIRIEVAEFAPDRSQRRAYRRGQAELEVTVGAPVLSAERVELYNRHKTERGLVGDGLIDLDSYEQFLVESCVDSYEIVYRWKGRLVGVAIADRAADALSAVYCFYDPGMSHLSLGTYSILKQIELCRRWRLRYLYLGLYVAGSPPMEYKVRYLPHERLIGGAWQRFDRPINR